MAGLQKAAGLLACLGEDADNLFITLSAKSINPRIFVVARVNRHQNEGKLKQAGADRVAQPYQIGGYHMANMALRPNVVDYIDVVASGVNSGELEVEEMVVANHSKLAGHHLGRALADSSISGATVIAIIGVDGIKKVRPSGNETIYPGDKLIILGSRHDLTTASSLIE
jgi:voltage-gated potassium channel